MNGRKRKNWEQYALSLATAATERSEDPHIQCGAAALRKVDNSIAGIGYNGAPSDIDIDWADRDERRKRVIHAEMNCLNYVLPGEVGLMAVTLMPCAECLKHIAAKRIPKVVYGKKHYDDGVEQLAKEFKIELKQIELS